MKRVYIFVYLRVVQKRYCQLELSFHAPTQAAAQSRTLVVETYLAQDLVCGRSNLATTQTFDGSEEKKVLANRYLRVQNVLLRAETGQLPNLTEESRCYTSVSVYGNVRLLTSSVRRDCNQKQSRFHGLALSCL